MVHLLREGQHARLVVNGQDWLILGGELGNSNASSLDVLQAQWPRLQALGLNTVLAPIYWELIEPVEGQFDFTLLEALLDGARRHGLRVVLLWFGAWKNSMSCYAPCWVKQDPARFPVVRLANGERTQILSAFSSEVLEADKRAFVALMTELRKLDERDETVVMVQVENEIGMLGAAREHGDAANAAFSGPVPEMLLQSLASLEACMNVPLRAHWAQAGAKTPSTWADVFGESAATEELLTAWHYARYVNSVATAGKAVYPIPMFVNAALNLPEKKPGDYPSGGPLPHLYEVWKLGAPNIDLLCPDIYFPEYEYWVTKYVRTDNPLFVPEIQRSEACGAQAIYAIGELRSLGFSPFAIENANGNDAEAIQSSYDILSQISPLVLRCRSSGAVRAVLLDKPQQSRKLVFGDIVFHAAHDFTCPWTTGDRNSSQWPFVSCLVVQISDSEFVCAGTGTIFTFSDRADQTAKVGLAVVEEGHFHGTRWVVERRLNGDETHQGRHVRIPYGKWGIQRIEIYRY